MKRDRILGIGAVIFGIVVALMTRFTVDHTIRVAGDPGAHVFPYITAVIFLLAGVSLIVRKQEGEDKVFMTKEQWVRLFTLFGVLVGYIVLIYFVGFSIATFVMMFTISMMFARGQNVAVWKVALYALVATLCVWALFRYVLRVFLPKGLLNLF